MADKRVFVLGAGASISHSKNISPNIESFFIKNDLTKTKKYQIICAHIKDTFDIDIQSSKRMPKINIEKIFTQLELDIENSQNPDLLAVKSNFLQFIQETLTNLESTVPLTNNSDYSLFYEKLEKTDTVMTFNWDIMLDDEMGRKPILEHYLLQRSNPKQELHKDKQYYNFILYLSGIRGMTWNAFGQGKPLLKWRGDQGYYLKMHGSVDWKYCDNDICKSSTNVFPVLEVNGEHHICSECYEEMKPLLLPPVLNKQYRRYSLIRKIWNAAAREMEIADEIVIWGYSLPPTDFYSEWLLRQANKSKIKSVSLIDPKVLKGLSREKSNRTINTTFVRKFSDIFQLDFWSPKLKYYENFEDYLNNITIEDKWGIQDTRSKR
jgi:hypothetical protein